MKATVIEIQSKDYLGFRRIGLLFKFGEGKGQEILRLPESCLGIVGIALDDEIDVKFSVRRDHSELSARFSNPNDV